MCFFFSRKNYFFDDFCVSSFSIHSFTSCLSSRVAVNSFLLIPMVASRNTKRFILLMIIIIIISSAFHVFFPFCVSEASDRNNLNFLANLTRLDHFRSYFWGFAVRSVPFSHFVTCSVLSPRSFKNKKNRDQQCLVYRSYSQFRVFLSFNFPFS